GLRAIKNRIYLLNGDFELHTHSGGTTVEITLLDDGSSGMAAIKRSGGRCIVQDPHEAEFPDMPNNVLRNVKVDYKGSLDEIGYVLSDLYSRDECTKAEVPRDIALEAEITLRMASDVQKLEDLCTLTHFTCPDCGGSLVKIANEDPPRYRCYTGHSFTERSLNNEQINALEESLWTAIRMMEERRNLLKSTNGHAGDSKGERAEQIGIHIGRLKDMLQQLGDTSTE
ncbi:MAG: hypothetical protein EOP48_19635, partial [Sphingobacteriales bacterium]